MPKPSAHHREVASAGGITAALLIGTLLGLYLLGFFARPLGSGPEGVSRLDYLLASLLRPDDFIRQWLTGASWQSLLERCVILGAAAVTLCVALAAGWTLLRLLDVDRAVSKLEMTLLSCGAGLNLVSLVTLVLGLAGWLNRVAFLTLGLFACAVAGLLYWRRGCASGSGNLQAGTEQNVAAADRMPVDRVWLWLALPFALAIVLSAMLPPFDFDVREYHLQAPKEFFQAGRISFLPHNVYANMPLGAELLSLPAMIALDDWWTGALVGKTLIAMFAPLTALLLYAAGCRFATPAAGVVAAIVYLSIPWVALVSTSGLIEGAFGFYLWAAFYMALVWRQLESQPVATANPTRQRGRGADTHDNAHSLARRVGISPRLGTLSLAGFLAGAACSTKYPAVLYSVLPLGAYIVYRTIASSASSAARGGLAGSIAKTVAVFLLAVAAGCGPWFIKNTTLTGNPVYPLLYGLFDGRTRTPEKDSQWREAHRPPNFDATDLAVRAFDAALGSRWVSPLVLPLATLAFTPSVARGRQRRLAWLLGAYLLSIFAAWWLLTHRIDRFLVPALPLAAMLAGLGATWSARTGWRRTLAALLAVGLVYDFAVIAGGPVADSRYLDSLQVLRVDPLRVDRWHLYFNEHADDVAGLLLVGGAQPFDLEVPATYNTVFDDSVFARLAAGQTPDQVRKALEEQGISHVLVNWSEIARYRAPGNYGITDFLQPTVFDELVAAGVLQPLPAISPSGSQAFRVMPRPTN